MGYYDSMESEKYKTYCLPWTIDVLQERLRRGEISLFPAQLRLQNAQSPLSSHARNDVIEADWNGTAARFTYLYKNRSSPKLLEEAISEATREAVARKLLPLVITPYLPERSLRRLEEAGVSGFDLCGNGLIRAPGMALWRSGQPNLFREPQPVRNVYRGNSSLLTRAFLLQTAYPSLTALQTYVLDRFQPAMGDAKKDKITKGTVSKVVKTLADERIVLRGETGVRLLSPALLLENLRHNYVRPHGRSVEGKTPLSFAEIWSALQSSQSTLEGAGMRVVATGLGSAGRYGLLSGPAKLSLYTDDFENTARLLQIKAGRVFPNIEIIEETSDIVYFDARDDETARWASPLQTYLELSSSGPREKEAAQTLETLFIKGEAINLL